MIVTPFSVDVMVQLPEQLPLHGWSALGAVAGHGVSAGAPPAPPVPPCSTPVSGAAPSVAVDVELHAAHAANVVATSRTEVRGALRSPQAPAAKPTDRDAMKSDVRCDMDVGLRSPWSVAVEMF
jgi:hypothetical protein